MKLRLEGVSLRVRRQDHLHALDLDIGPAGITVLLGPALAGKTSLLRLMAGLDRPTQGSVLTDGRDVTRVPACRRDVAMVYPHLINYPTLTVSRNIAAPLTLRGAADIEATVATVAERLRIGHLLDRLPRELSAEEQQRVAIARALARGAPLLLLDEPLASLDCTRREPMREELAALLDESPSAVVYATAEPTEALQLGGHVAILHEGRLLQHGRTIDVYMRPATVAVARVFGDPPMNLVPARLERNALHLAQGQVQGSAPGLIQGSTPGPRIALHAPLATDRPEVTVGIRPASLAVTGHAGDVRFDARVELVEISGTDSRVHVASRAGPLVAQLAGVHRFEPGQNLSLYADPGALHVFDHAGALLLAPELAQLRDAQLPHARSAQPAPATHGAH